MGDFRRLLSRQVEIYLLYAYIYMSVAIYCHNVRHDNTDINNGVIIR